MKPTILFISCEHAINMVPNEYLNLFCDCTEILNTHLGCDIGASLLTDHLASACHCEMLKAPVSKLLIDCNKSIKNKDCFSVWSKQLSPFEKKSVIEAFYLSYRNQVKSLINSHIQKGEQVLHLSVHTFTPTLRGVTAQAAIALLYNTHRHAEQEVARVWCSLLSQESPNYRVRLNYPFRASHCGFTEFLRREYEEKDYLGVQLEVNEALTENSASLQILNTALSSSLNELINYLN